MEEKTQEVTLDVTGSYHTPEVSAITVGARSVIVTSGGETEGDEPFG